MVAQIIAILKGITSLASILKSAGELYIKYKNSRIDKHYAEKKRRKSELVKQIELEGSRDNVDDEILKKLHRKLYNITSGK